MADSKTAQSAEAAESAPSLPAVTDQQKEYAKQALKEFENRQYSACVSWVSKLVGHRSSDSKVAHNKAVVDFYNSGCKNVEAFKRTLENLCQMTNLSLDSREDVDHAVIFYNRCIVLYHQRQYHTALKILDKLFQIVEPLDEYLTKKTLVLLVELYLCTHQPEKAMSMIGYMEKLYLPSSKSSSGGQGDDDKGENKDTKETKDGGDGENWKARISMYKTRCLIMLKSTKLCKREVKYLISTQSTNTTVIYLKSNFEYIRGNNRKAIKMLGTAPQAQLFTEMGECLPLMYFNNLGCIHFHMRKHHLGSFYFRKAVRENENALKDTGTDRPLHKHTLSRHFELLYNMGIQLLHCDKPLAAFDCLIEAVQVYQTNPRIWLRLAECCIQANRPNNEEDRNLEKRMEVIKGSVGSGIHRKLIIGTGIYSKDVSNNHPAIPQASLEFASLCLRNAMLHLNPLEVEKVVTTDESSDGIKPVPVEPTSVAAPPGNPMKPNEVAHLRSSILAASSYVALNLNNHLMALHYAEDLLKQPKLSGAQKYIGHLYMAEALVELDRIADAITHLNPESVTDISTCPPEMKSDQDKQDKGDKGEKDLLAESTEAKSALYPWSPKDMSRAKAIMQYNLATAHAMRGEYDKAMSNLTESSKNIGTPLPAQMYFLKLYLDLMEGRRKMAQFVIKDHFGHVTPNRV
ncbi:CCR4-NOT transcription complex subunit 10-like [Gigantopelta aegis]|uniref:CCR4-NOT transcription complex subunit 10-like n=1 Tax=Gigantopelta aegis TaxID=1735272 RepID=UPI001B888767|nr:CCR4-NOT transcription complex subunit 10-like [Gigantopelta aegis]XP_041375362.1 CCR4-NOT transcription complex subunit 10-like [Gigantopelta aegis]